MYAKERLGADIRSKTGRGPQAQNAREVDKWIREVAGPSFQPARLRAGPTEETIQKALHSQDHILAMAGEAEPLVRQFVLTRLKEYHGDGWWKRGIPGDLKRSLDAAWAKRTYRDPSLRLHQSENEGKFEQLGLGELGLVVCYGENWPDVFEQVFQQKDEFGRRLRDLMEGRNARGHAREAGRQGIVDTLGGLLWFAHSMGENRLDPFHEERRADASTAC